MTTASALERKAEGAFRRFVQQATFGAPGLIAGTACALPVQARREVRQALPGRLPFTLDPEPGPPDLRQWSRWLFASGAVHRVDIGAGGGWPHHQPTPSARCLYPAQISLMTPEVTGDGGQTLNAGVYRYDPLHHQLIERGAPVLPALREHLGSPLSGMFAGAAVSLDWQRTHGHYGLFGYRLALLEAGMQAAQLGIVAEALGWHTSLLWDFPDAPVNAVLGMGENERAAALVLLRRTPGTVSLPAYLPVSSTHGHGSSDRSGAALESLDRATHLQLGPERGTAAVGRPWRVTPGLLNSGTLLQTIRARHSGEPVFAPVPEPGRLPLLEQLLLPALAPFPLVGSPGAGDVSIDAVLNTPEGPQHFRLEAGASPAVRRPVSTSVLEAALKAIQPDMPLAQVPLVVYLCAPLHGPSPRDYRRRQLQVGLMAQRMLLLAAQHGWAGRASCSFNALQAKRALGLDASVAPLLQLAFGREPLARQVQSRYRLGLHP